jgi:hypothetical protein
LATASNLALVPDKLPTLTSICGVNPVLLAEEASVAGKGWPRLFPWRLGVSPLLGKLRTRLLAGKAAGREGTLAS